MKGPMQQFFNPAAIKLAFYRVRCWTGRLNKDRVALKAFEKNLDANCTALSERIIGGQYVPQRGFKYYLPKPSKTTRTLTILRLEDALIYQCIANEIARLNYPILAEHEDFVFGSVLSPEVTKGTALLDEAEPSFFFFRYWKVLFPKFANSVIRAIEVDQSKYKLETDITGFFDSIPHYSLLQLLSERFGVPDDILDLLSDCLNLWSGTRQSMTPGVGIPQGPAPSFFFANLFLHGLDEALVGKAYRYYRYMDDFNIYGDTEKDLQRALVVIDQYLKGHGLSINSKKTSIEFIADGQKDRTNQEMKKILKSSFGLLEALEDGEPEEVRAEIEKNISSLSDQDFFDVSELLFSEKSINVIVDEEEIKVFWLEQIAEVEQELPKHFEKSEEGVWVVKKGVDDRDIIGLSAQFGRATSALKNLNRDYKVTDTLLHYWLTAYRAFFWRADILGYTLMHYENNSTSKIELVKMYADFELYEWMRYHVVEQLFLTQSFSDAELRGSVFSWLNAEESLLVKIALYRLLFAHAKSDQFRTSVRKKLSAEQSEFLKLEILDFSAQRIVPGQDLKLLMDTIGL